MSKQFSEDEILHLAGLAHIKLRDDEVVRLSNDLNVINDAIKKVSEVATDDVEPTLHPIAVNNVFRDDVPATLENDLLSQESALAGGPKIDDGQFVSPQILGEE